MKKQLSILAILVALISGAYSLENVFSFDYAMPVLAYSDADYYYTQLGVGFMADYRAMSDRIGLQVNCGFEMPVSLDKTSRSTNNNTTYTLEDDQVWSVFSLFGGCAIRVVNTNLVELCVTPGVGVDFEHFSDKHNNFSNINMGFGVDITTNVKLFNFFGITGGVLIEYQTYSINSNNKTDVISHNATNMLLIMPRAGFSMTL